MSFLLQSVYVLAPTIAGHLIVRSFLLDLVLMTAGPLALLVVTHRLAQRRADQAVAVT